MPLPRPQNVRYNENRDVDFEVEIDGRKYRGTVTKEAVHELYAANPDPIRAVENSSEITRFVARKLRSGEDDGGAGGWRIQISSTDVASAHKKN